MKRNNGFTLIELLVVVIIIGILLSIGVGSCSQIFFQSIHTGVVTENVKMGEGNTGIFASQDAKEIAFSRAVSIIEDNNNILTFSTVDRQFAVVQVGDKVKVKVFQYPPWDFTKGGTYHNGRLLSRSK